MTKVFVEQPLASPGSAKNDIVAYVLPNLRAVQQGAVINLDIVTAQKSKICGFKRPILFVILLFLQEVHFNFTF